MSLVQIEVVGSAGSSTHSATGFALPLNEQPPQRLEQFGVSAVSDVELLAIILQGSGTRTHEAVTIAGRLISEAGSMSGLLTWGAPEYRRLKGIGRMKGLQLSALAEIARRMMRSRPTGALLNRADLVAEQMAPIVAGLDIEKFWVLCLNRKNRLLKKVEISSGTATAVLAHPREVYRAAIRESASAIICTHNHPSGDPAPSSNDITLTRLLRQAAQSVDIQLVDHVIIGSTNNDPLNKGYFSFREGGML